MTTTTGAQPAQPETAPLPGGTPRRALLVLTRDPGGERNGRKAVLATIAQSLEDLGHQVSVVVLSRDPVADTWQGRSVTWVQLPALPRVFVNASRTLVTRHGSLNEALFESPRIRRAVAGAARDSHADYVVADGMRTTTAAQGTGLPVIAHLDDLLSERYREIRSHGVARYEVLGYFEAQIPGIVRGPARSLARHVLRVEAKLMGQRELQVVSEVAACALTSPVEAATLARRSGKPVACLPMAVDPVSDADAARPGSAPASSFAFLGSPDFAPNLESLRWWKSEIRPMLDSLGGEDITLSVIGHANHAHRTELEDSRLRFLGYVDDLSAELGKHRALAAPVTMGTGVKTKVVDALACGLPVVGTPRAVAGLPVRAGHDALVGTSAEEFSRAVLQVRDDAVLAARLGQAGRELSGATFSTVNVRDGWAALLADVGVLVAQPRSG